MRLGSTAGPGPEPRPSTSSDRCFVIWQGRAYFTPSTLLGALGVALPLFLWPVMYLSATRAPWWTLLIGAACMVSIHEGSHALAYGLLGGRRLRAGVRFWLHVVPMAASVLLEDPMPRLRIAAVLLVPLVLVPAVLTLVLGVNPLWVVLAWINLAGAMGDVIVAATAPRCRAKVLQDTTEGLVIVG